MLPRDPLALPPVARTSVAPGVEAVGDPRQQAFQRALAGQLGKSMQGEVLARLADGGYVVRVAGMPARMQLPAGAQLGAELPLTLVALHPRPTFQVGPGADGPATFTEAGVLPSGYDSAAATEGGAAARISLSRAAALLASAPLSPAAHLPGLGADDGSPASLSAAGKAIGNMLAAALKADGAPGAVVATGALVGTPGADPGQLAAALRKAIGHSGLFYESHVAEWAQGQRSLGELAAEPQMQAARAGRQPGTDPASAQLVSLQLATHEQGQVAWQGQAWPGQPLHLELQRGPLERDAPDGRPSGEDGHGTWQSRLRLRFALLGELSASVVLSGAQLHVRLDAGDSATGELLRAHAERLAGALDAAGTPLASLAIHTAKDADG
jgi:hypothetical protein